MPDAVFQDCLVSYRADIFWYVSRPRLLVVAIWSTPCRRPSTAIGAAASVLREAPAVRDEREPAANDPVAAGIPDQRSWRTSLPT